ncbi:MAG: Nucleoid occlusion protein [Syntrophus sp. SKADARSKE-3]|nr:Nucleoid occlusion protein [Syntrophus sp. SKADARSKE-3]
MNEEIIYLTPKQIVANPLNPRKDVGDVIELRQSIVQHGIIEPVIVRTKGDKYELIAGERRHAAVVAGIKTKDLDKGFLIPAIVREMDDEAVIQTMLVENMQREGLTDYEQAVSFRDYLAAIKNPKADDICSLAERTGLDHRYIRRRIKILDLPEAALDLWKDGVLTYGHLEQLLRVSEDAIFQFLNSIGNGQYVPTVRDLKHRIDSVDCLLSKAVFDKKAAGCPNCAKNSQVQKNLFGDDFKMSKVTCLDKACFHKQTHDYLTNQWAESAIAKEHGTNGFAIYSYNHSDHNMFRDEPFEKCKACASYVSIIREAGEVVINNVCYKNDACFNALTNEARVAQGLPPMNAAASGKTENKAEVRAIKHGTEFAEAFFKEQLANKFMTCPVDDTKILVATAMVLFRTNPKVADQIINEDYPSNPENTYEAYYRRGQQKQSYMVGMLQMNRDQALAMIQRITSKACLEPEFSLDERVAIGEYYDLRLDRDFIMTRDYLSKKTKAELVDMARGFKLVDTTPFISAISALKSGGVSDLKKSALVEAFMANDLTGKIPAEILDVKLKREIAVAVNDMDQEGSNNEFQASREDQ